MAYTLGSSSRFTQLKTGLSSTATRNDFRRELIFKTGKVSGNVITYPTGETFRKATAIQRLSSKIDVGSPQIYEGKRLTAPIGDTVLVRSSPGGYAGDVVVGNSTLTGRVNGRSIVASNTYPVIPALMRNEAVTEALNDISSQKAAIGEDLATFSQTVRMIANPTRSLAKGLKKVWADQSVHRYLHESALSLARKGIANRAASRYLEYVYGWKPLMQDIYGLVEYAKHMGPKPLLVHGRGNSRSQGSIPDVNFGDASQAANTTLFGMTENIKVQCSLWARIDPNYTGLRALQQLGLLNPASLAWELVPWSFVVDWLCPIGPVLSALTARAGLLFVDGTVSVRTSAEGTYEHAYVGLDSTTQWKTQQQATGHWSYEGYTRTTCSDWPLPGFWIDTDPLGLDSDSDRSLKALALTLVNLKSLRRL